MGPPTDRDNIYTALMKALDGGQEIGLQSLYKWNHLIKNNNSFGHIPAHFLVGLATTVLWNLIMMEIYINEDEKEDVGR